MASILLDTLLTQQTHNCITDFIFWGQQIHIAWIHNHQKIFIYWWCSSMISSFMPWWKIRLNLGQLTLNTMCVCVCLRVWVGGFTCGWADTGSSLLHISGILPHFLFSTDEVFLVQNPLPCTTISQFSHCSCTGSCNMNTFIIWKHFTVYYTWHTKLVFFIVSICNPVKAIAQTAYLYVWFCVCVTCERVIKKQTGKKKKKN